MRVGVPEQLTDLPWQDVVFQHILPHLSVLDLCRLCAVSKAFHTLSDEYFYTCKQLDFSHYTMTETHFTKLIGKCRNLHRLSVAGCSWLTDAPLRDTFRHNTNLLHVDLSKCTSLRGAALQVLAVRCKKLKSLCVEGCPWFTEGNLQVLTLHQCELQSINLSGCWSVKDQDLVEFFEKFRKLKEVRLNQVEGISDNCLYHMAVYCQELQVLEVASCWRISDKGITTVVDACPIKRLNVKGCPNISEKYLCNLHGRGIAVTSNFTLADMVKRRRHVDRLGIHVQI